MRTRILLSLLASFLLAGTAWYTLDTKMSAVYHLALWSEPYEYMFSETGESVELAGREYTRFEAGWKGVFMYGELRSAMEKSLSGSHGYPQDFYNLEALADFSGIPPFQDGKVEFDGWNSEAFLHYNPTFVAWAVEHMIPRPDEVLEGVTYQRIYDVVGARFVRLLAETHVLLEQEGMAGEAELYNTGIQGGDFDAFQYMEARGYVLNDLNARYATSGADSPFTPGMAYTWWVRRVLDESEPLLWESLQDVLAVYDPEFLDSL